MVALQQGPKSVMCMVMHMPDTFQQCLQASSDASVPTEPQPPLRQASDGIPGSRQSSTHARLARAQAAARLSTELQEVVRHASLALLLLADADAIIGLRHYCLHTFGGLHQLTDGGGGRKDGSNSSSSLSELTQTAGEGNAGVAVGKDDAIIAMLQHPNMFVDGSVEQHQFDWLEGAALQVSWFVLCSIASPPDLSVCL